MTLFRSENIFQIIFDPMYAGFNINGSIPTDAYPLQGYQWFSGQINYKAQ